MLFGGHLYFEVDPNMQLKKKKHIFFSNEETCYQAAEKHNFPAVLMSQCIQQIVPAATFTRSQRLSQAFT